jgi:two-component system cell cycle sensor histidine kinase/response regulator CckA
MRDNTVQEAESGVKALALVADQTLQVDPILTDVMLLDADGPTWVRKVLAERPGTEVVFMSGYAEDAFAKQKVLIEGPTFLPKSVFLKGLTSGLERHLVAAGNGGAAPEEGG